MDIKKLQSIVVNALEDVKAQEIRVFDTIHLTSLFDRIAIASGTSNRQTKALAASVRDKVKESGGDIVSIEGEDSGEWVLVDLGDMIVHIMQPPIRAYYRLEEIWGDKEVKLSDAKRAPKRKGASEDEDAPPATAKRTGRHLTVNTRTDADAAPKKAAARKAATKQAAGKTAAAPKTAGKSAKAAAPKSTAARKAPAKSAAKTAAKSGTKSGAKSAVKAGAKQAASKRAPAKAKSA